MLTDIYGNHLTTSTGLARDSYDIGLRAFLSANYGAQEAFSQSIEADPNFALAYLGLTRAFMSSGQVTDAKVALGKAKNLLGVITDGDIKRIMSTHKNIEEISIKKVMTRKPFKINSDILAVEALSILEKNNISALPVLDKSKITGIVTMQNIIKSIN